MKKENGIEELYSYYEQQIRELIDNASGLIFENYPNIKEKIKSHKEIKYTDTNSGKIFLIKPNQENIEITDKKEKKSKIVNNYEEIKDFFN